MIGTAAAILGAAAIGAVGSVLSSGSQKKAANQAAQVAQSNDQANNQLARDVYGSNLGILSPYSDMGLRAGRTLNDLLLGPSTPPAPSVTFGGYGPSYNPVDSFGSLGGATGALTGYTAPTIGGMGGGSGSRPLEIRLMGGEPYLSGGDGSAGPSGGVYSPQPFGAPQPYDGSTLTTAAPSSAPSAWDTFRNSTNYQFRLGEGERALNQGYAGKGELNSGAASKALLRYGQDYASNELNNYMGLLSGQQNMGLNAARAVAGVGGDLVNQVTSNNNAATGVTANAALASGQASAGMYNGIGTSLARALGALGGSSYAPKAPPNVYGM